jgi:hypothetical protein
MTLTLRATPGGVEVLDGEETSVLENATFGDFLDDSFPRDMQVLHEVIHPAALKIAQHLRPDATPWCGLTEHTVGVIQTYLAYNENIGTTYYTSPDPVRDAFFRGSANTLVKSLYESAMPEFEELKDVIARNFMVAMDWTNQGELGTLSLNYTVEPGGFVDRIAGEYRERVAKVPEEAIRMIAGNSGEGPEISWGAVATPSTVAYALEKVSPEEMMAAFTGCDLSTPDSFREFLTVPSSP